MSSIRLKILTISSFVEKLLKDREFLVKGVQALYQRLQDLNSWERPPPAKLINGEPYIHSLLDRLGIMTSNEEDETTTGSEGDTSLADTAVVNTAIVDTAIVDTAIVDTALDTALVDTCFDMTPEVENNFHELSFSASTYLHLTPPITPYRGPADVDLTLTQALNPYHVSTQPAPLLTPPTDNSCSSIHMETGVECSSTSSRTLFHWGGDGIRVPVKSLVHRTVRLWGTTFSLSAVWSKSRTEEYDVLMQQSPL